MARRLSAAGRSACAAWIGLWLGAASLAAQTYISTTGQTSISADYDPTGPAPKAPVTVAAPSTLPFLAAVPAGQYLDLKAAAARFSQSSFTSPALVDVMPGGARAPGAATPIAATPSFSWQGIPPVLQPPSPDMAVGASDALMVINSNLAQFTRPGTLVSVTSFQSWFNDVLATTCPSSCLLFDPWIVYDQLHGRFLLLVGATPSSQPSRTFSYLLLSVSKGATFAGGWKNFALNASAEGMNQTQFWGDSWRLGYDNVAIYLSGNMYNVSGNFQYAKVRVLKKSDVYNPTATTLAYQELGSGSAKLRNADATIAFSLVPIRQRGSPNSAAVGLLVNTANVPNLPAAYLTVWKIADPLATPLTMTPTTLTGTSYGLPAPAPELGTSATLDSGDTRILKAVYRSGFLYTARDTGYTDQATTITYDVIDTVALKIASQARLLNTNAFYPAFDIPATVPAGTQFASTSLITGTTTAPDGTLTYPGISSLKNGTGYFDINFGATSRWGDYFGGTVDPVSGGLWVSGEYALAPLSGGFGQSGTWAGYFPWLTTSAFTDVPSTSPYYDFINVLSSWQITTGCSANPPLFCPTNIVTRDQIATFVIRSMLGNTFTYSNTPHFTDVPATSPFFPYIQKLADLGLTHGCTATTYCPGNPVLRQDAAVLLVRGKLESLFGDNFTFPTTPFFTDVPATSPQFPYVQKMYELGLTTGCSATQFCPTATMTRQEAAVFLTRAFLN